MRSAIARVVANEDLNFLLTNRLPRRLATRVVGAVSRIESPLLARALIGAWGLFADVDLSDAATRRFPSLHACFTRALRPGARPADPRPDVLASPCDAIVGACGRVVEGVAYQVKGLTYSLRELLGTDADVTPFRNGRFATLRLTSSMYHRFHAPCDLTVDRVRYISGDTWNVNPVSVKRIEKLFCKNERAVLNCLLPDGTPMLLVPVAAILVASIRLHFLDADRCLRAIARAGRFVEPAADPTCDIACHHHVARGQEMGWFEHGSTILVFTPDGFEPADPIAEGSRVRAGQALFRRNGGPA
jgi:phosphatidylserine decarboxylase